MTDEPRETMKELAAAYVLGALEPEEMRQFQSELSRSAALQEEVQEYREVAALLALEAPDVQPPASGWETVRQRIARGGRAPRVAKRSAGLVFAWSTAIAAGLVAIVIAGRANDFERRLGDAVAELSTATVRLAEQDSLLTNILSGTTEQFVLTSAGPPEPSLRVFWNRETNVMVLNALELYPPQEDRVYQFWFIQTDGAIIPSETFRTSPAGQVTVSVLGPPVPEQLNQAAVSIEPVGGSQQPTGQIVLAGAAVEQ